MMLFLPNVPAVDFHFIAKVVEPITQKIQKYVGIDCFFWARICFAITFVTSVLAVFIWSVELSNSPKTMLLMVFLDAGNMMLSRMLLKSEGVNSLNQIRKDVYKELASGCRNKFIYWQRPLVATSITLSIMIVSDVFVEDLGELIKWSIVKMPFIFRYLGTCFISCTPLRQEKSKLQVAVGEVVDALRVLGGGPAAQPA